MNQAPNKKDLQIEAQTFQKSFESVHLATISADGKPHASYAPCVVDEAGATYIFISGLARHTQNLRNNPNASLLFLETEENSPNIFARQRLNLDCQASTISRSIEDWQHIINQFETKFGNIINLLKSLPDFQLFRFDVEGGSFVKGFGQAYALKGNDLQILERRSK